MTQKSVLIDDAAHALQPYEGRRAHVTVYGERRSSTNISFAADVTDVELMVDSRGVEFVTVGFEGDGATTPGGEPYGAGTLMVSFSEPDFEGVTVHGEEWYGAVELRVAGLAITFWPTADADPTPRGPEPGR